MPFRNEADLLEEGETAKSVFNRHMDENDSLYTLRKAAKNAEGQREFEENQ